MSGLRKIFSVFALREEGKEAKPARVDGPPKLKRSTAVLRKKPPRVIRHNNTSVNCRPPEHPRPCHLKLQGSPEVYNGHVNSSQHFEGIWAHAQDMVSAVHFDDGRHLSEERGSRQPRADEDAFLIPRKPIANPGHAHSLSQADMTRQMESSSQHQHPPAAVQDGCVRQSRYFVTNPDPVISETESDFSVRHCQPVASRFDRTIPALEQQKAQSVPNLRIPGAFPDERLEDWLNQTKCDQDKGEIIMDLSEPSSTLPGRVDGVSDSLTDQADHVASLKLKGKEKKHVSRDDKLAPSTKKSTPLGRDTKLPSNDRASLRKEYDSLRGDYELLDEKRRTLIEQYESLQAIGEGGSADKEYSLSLQTYKSSREEYNVLEKEYLASKNRYESLRKDYELARPKTRSHRRASGKTSSKCKHQQADPSLALEEDGIQGSAAPGSGERHSRPSSPAPAGELLNDQLDSFLQKVQDTPLKRRDCIVCGDSLSVLDFPAKVPTTACTHPPQTCTTCLQTWVTSEVSTKGTSGGIDCPECPATLTYHDIQRAASPATFTTYDTLKARAALGDLGDFSWCLSPTCTSGQENPPGANFMHCLACGYEQCLSHRMPWHQGETCTEYDYRLSGQKARDEAEAKKLKEERKAMKRREEDEKKTAAMIDGVGKLCPNPKGCGWRIQKVDGCDHMTCRRCRWEFCWVCLAAQGEIRRVGNTAHAVGCKYHSKNLQVAFPFNAH